MKEIILTQGYKAVVDDGDFERISSFKWHVAKRLCGHIYASRVTPEGVALMHREILHAPKGFVVDHINNDGLDNRRENLRLCRQHENIRNRGKHKKLSSSFKGVYFESSRSRNHIKNWRSRIFINKKTMISLGIYLTEIEAARAYDVAAKRYFGKFAKTNFFD